MDDCLRVSEVFDTIRALFRRVDQKREPTVVNEIVLDVLQSMREELTEHGVTIETELTPELQLVDGHRHQLRQVIFNLIHNAIESMDNTMDRSRVLRVKTKSHGPDSIIVAVEDSGPGIDPTGLGLAICRMIVERHDGKLFGIVGRQKWGAVSTRFAGQAHGWTQTRSDRLECHFDTDQYRQTHSRDRAAA
jgi:signal transduction histidine kinase